MSKREVEQRHRDEAVRIWNHIIVSGTVQTLAQALADAESTQPAERDGEWLSPKVTPEVDSFAWITWNGVVQKQPWQFINTDEDEQSFHFEGHMLTLNEIDGYWPDKPPAPPQPKGTK